MPRLPGSTHRSAGARHGACEPPDNLNPWPYTRLGCHVVAQALNPNGRFLFTSPEERCTSHDLLTDRESVSLGANRYLELLHAEGFSPLASRRMRGVITTIQSENSEERRWRRYAISPLIC
jgi:hypothetical protein